MVTIHSTRMINASRKAQRFSREKMGFNQTGKWTLLLPFKLYQPVHFHPEMKQTGELEPTGLYIFI